MSSDASDPFQKIKSTLIKSFGCSEVKAANKITIVGLGKIGISTAVCILGRSICDEMVLIENNEKKAKAEMLDLMHGSVYNRNIHVVAGSDFALTKNSRICIIASEATTPSEGTSRTDLLQENADLVKQVTKDLVKHSPNTILIVATYPVDSMTYVAARNSGLPKNQVIGTGCMLDTARLNYLLGEKLSVGPESCLGYVLGEHGDNGFIAWSTVSIGGVKLTDLDPKIPCGEVGSELLKNVLQADTQVKELKGYTNWPLALTATQLCEEILRDTRRIHAVTVNSCGFHGIDDEVFLSLPCVIGINGVMSVVNQNLAPNEKESLIRCKDCLLATQKAIKL